MSLQDANNRIKELMSRRSQNQNQINGLQQTIHNLRSQRPQGAKEVGAWEQKLMEGQAQLKEALRINEDLQKQYDVILEQVNSMEGKNETLRKSIEEQKQKFQRDQKNRDAINRFDKLLREVGLYKNEITSLKTQLKQKNVLDTMWQNNFSKLTEVQVKQDQDKLKKQLEKDNVQAGQFEDLKSMWKDSHSQLVGKRREQDETLLKARRDRDEAYEADFDRLKEQWRKDDEKFAKEQSKRDDSLDQKLGAKKLAHAEQLKQLNSKWKDSFNRMMNEQKISDDNLFEIQRQNDERHDEQFQALNNEWQQRYDILIKEEDKLADDFQKDESEREIIHEKQSKDLSELMYAIKESAWEFVVQSNSRGKRETYNAEGEELWRMVEDRKAQMASKFNLTTSGGQGSVSLPAADQRLFCLCGNSGNFLN